MNGDKYIIKASATVIDALRQLNSLSGGAMTLFVVEDDGRVIGSLTDGDIRRCLIAGAELATSLSEVVHRDFIALRGESIDIKEIRRLRESRVTLVPRLTQEGKLKALYDFSSQKSLLPVDAVLMAGGKGERLRPLTNDTPKPLLKLGGKCIIDYNIESLAKNGVSNISVTVNYLAEQIEEHFSQPVAGVGVKCVKEPVRMGTIGSLSLIESYENDTILIMNSDLFTNINFEEMYISHADSGADITVAVTPYMVSVPYAIFHYGKNGDVTGLEEKPTYNYYANAGIYMIKREMLSLIPQGEYYDATDMLEDAIKNGFKVRQFPINGTWIDIGSPADFRHAQDVVQLGKMQF